jgi:glycosyltransferase involved in cell wall biosynthesis
MYKQPKVSIIIPLYIISDRFFQDFQKFNNLKYKDFEILIITDKKINLPNLNKNNVRLILTKRKTTGPAEKRDLALKYVKGELCAFIDDDAFPNPEWLKMAVPWFKNPDIVAVGGPGLTPPTSTFWEKITGYILESYLCSGEIQIRFYSNQDGRTKMVVDWPAYNLIVRTTSLKKVGGYGSTFYGGEDTLLCLKLLKLGNILYSPSVIVYHHRRKFPLDYLKQIYGVGIHRGYFFKKYPETSRSVIYLMPFTLTLGLVTGIFISIIQPWPYSIAFISLLIFVIGLSFWSVKRHGRATTDSLLAAFGILLTHITYGLAFIRGLSLSDLKR